MKIKVKVPASSANLGPGFDVFGLAVELYNEFMVETADKFNIEINGNNEIPRTKDNLFYQSFACLFKKSKARIPSVKISMKINIPPGRGFGSSATAVVGGLLAANSFLEKKYSSDELLPMAVGLEQGKHPDNVTPALLGGFVVATMNKDKTTYIKLPFPKELKAVYFTPEFKMDTVKSRRMMPKKYLRSEAVFNIGRAALMLAAFQTGKHHLLKEAMQDRIHQPTRTKIFPIMPEIIQTAIDKGAYGAALSGGGSSIIAFADKKFTEISRSMYERARENNIMGETRILDINHTGSEIKLIEI